MKYLVLVLNDGMSRIEKALLCSDGEVDLECHEVLPPSPAPVPASVSPVRSPPPLSPVFPPSPPAPLVNPEASSLLQQYRRELLERSLLRTAEGQQRAVCPCERLPVEEDECLNAVNLLFPDPWLNAAENGGDIFKSPAMSPEPWIDLSSYDSDVEEVTSHFFLDCPEDPSRECSSCGFHQAQSGIPGIMCSLCYMRQTYHCIYSPVSEEEM
ncbi:211R [Bovine adenovirus 3]|uniref:211R n=1 Tax=Bovine adenovirus B serotype 3 TaxID=10510 RepID=Q64842_ADEB3|nr:211R [Bovine adenovirus 3]AP_000021.1 E1A [Bovine mastadenovirus B]AAD09714.1 211R [Bovine adenovirus 3]BAA04816.1 E1A protein [Bovine adenovirus 3]